MIGEKQAAALEPLLATPLTSPSCWSRKCVTPFVPVDAALAATLLPVPVAHGWPGASRASGTTIFWPRTLLLYGLLGPLVSWTALMLAAIVSSRVNDARTAQQLGGFLACQSPRCSWHSSPGQFLLGVAALLLTALALVLVNVVLTWIGVRVFQRETILMRWR